MINDDESAGTYLIKSINLLNQVNPIQLYRSDEVMKGEHLIIG